MPSQSQPTDMKPLPIQVPPTQYYETYDDLDRFISYYHQIDAVRKLDPKEVLEIGIGNRTVTNYLKQHGYRVTTCDFDGRLGPDFEADVRRLPFEDASFDVALAFEILEHLPFEEVPRALSELSRVSRRHVVISIPYSSCAAEILFNIRLPRISKKIRLALRLPFFFMRAGIRGKNREHHWEMGRRHYSKKTIRSLIGKYFDIEEEYMPEFDAYHCFFVLTKKTNHSEAK